MNKRLSRAVIIVHLLFLGKAWYDKACLYAKQNHIDIAMENLVQAIKLHPECREMAKTNSDFDNIPDEPEFKALIDDN